MEAPRASMDLLGEQAVLQSNALEGTVSYTHLRAHET